MEFIKAFLTLFLALWGFAPKEVQAEIPPYLGLISVAAASYFGGVVISLVVHLMGLHWAIDAGIRGIGVGAVLLTLHSVYRVVGHRDEYSWGGVIRKVFLR